MRDWPRLVEEEKAYVGNAFRLQTVFDADQQFPVDEQNYLRQLLALIQQHVPQGSSFLDVGAGSGRLLQELRPHLPGWQLRGLDPVYCGDAVSLGDVFSRVAPSAQADVVLLKEVVQHVSGIEQALGNAASMVRAGGLLVVIERNPFSFLGLLKPLLEHLGRWMYPAIGPFRERWYGAARWQEMLGRLGTVVSFSRYDSSVGRRIFFGYENRFFVMAVRIGAATPPAQGA